MANIPALPTGQAILARGKAKEGVANQYGPGSTFVVLEQGTVVLRDAGKHTLANTMTDGTYAVDLTSLDPSTVPYVNRFIADWAFVKRDWRTKTYKVQSGLTEALAAAVETPAAQVAPVMAPSIVPLDSATVTTFVVEPEPEPETETTVVVTAGTTEVAVTVTETPDNIPAPQPLAKVKRRKVAGTDVVTIGKVTIPEDDYETLLDAWEARQTGATAAVLITGPSGTAKTLMVKAFAATLGVPFIKVDGGAIRTADDWFGVLRLSQGATNYVFSPFGQALKQGVRCVVLLDEANRAETPQALNAALGLLDETGTVHVPDARETLSLPQGMLVVVTANKGAEYVGTVPFDAAVLQRFGSGVALNYPVEAVEVEVVTEVTGIDKARAKTLVNMANHQRPLKDDLTQFPSGTGVSTRMLVDIARRTMRGTDIRKAVVSNANAQFDAEDMPAMRTIIDIYFPGADNDTLDVDVNAIEEGGDI
jgi:hypothetical protein